MSFNKIFDKLKKEEEDFMKSDFFSPVLKNQPVRVKISNIITEMQITKPSNFEGWGVFRPVDAKKAMKIRDVTLSEKEKYFDLFPMVRIILCLKTNNIWYGVQQYSGDARFSIMGAVPVRLTEEVQLFDAVCARFDGNTFWFEKIDSRYSPSKVQKLRSSVVEFVEEKDLEVSGLTKEEKAAYNIALIDELKNAKDWEEEKIKDALRRTGANYKSYVDRNNAYTVEFSIDGKNHKSTVSKDNLTVLSAGICLNGHDSNFDLQSLVSVIREGYDGNKIYRV